MTKKWTLLTDRSQLLLLVSSASNESDLQQGFFIR